MADHNPPIPRSVGPPQAVPRCRAPTLPELVERWIRETPDAVALLRGEHHLTYGELGRRALRLARRLAALGVGPEIPVGVCLPPSPAMLVAWLAVTRAGGAYVPLEPEHPAARRRWMIEDAGARALIATEGSARGLTGGDLPILWIDGLEGPGEPETPVRLPGPLPDHAAYVLYTSGSTGRPKGVVVTHRSLANVLAWYQRRYGMAPGVRSSQIAGPGFDASVLEIWPALAAGATVVFPVAPLRGSARELGRFLTRERIDVAFVPPVMARELATGPTPPPLRAMILGGDRAPSLPRLPFPAYNHYGPTEATVQVTAARIEADDPAPPIGRPIDRVRVHLLEEDLQPVEPGEVGEIWVAGAGVSRGYVGRPGRTAEAFRPNPLAEEPGGRMYRTGDLGRRRPDGRLEFRGRVDHQVKVRGVRVEPGEVEAVLEEHPAVRHAAVALRELAPGDERLVAWVATVQDGDTPEEGLPARLRRHLAERLPAPFVPAVIQPVAQLPRTARGKVDRDALPTPELARLVPRGPRVTPRTERERELLDLFQEVLGVPDLGITDDFFALGGHSLLATRLVSRIRRRWEVELAVGTVFDEPTVAGLAARVEAAEGRGRALPPIEPRPRRGTVPLSYAQQRLWFLDRLQPGNPFYNIPMAWNLEGRVDPRALTQALGEILRRHEALRTRLPVRGGEARQHVDPPAPWTVPEVDLSGLGEEDRERQTRSLGLREAGRPFRLHRDRLVRTARLRLAPGRSVFLWTIHHVVADGWSLGVLVDEIAPLYEAWTRGRPSPLVELPIQYADFARWQREHVAGELLERELGHWERRLAGAPRLELPLDRPRPTVQAFRGARRRFTLGASAARRLRDLSRRHGVSLFMTLLAGFEALLARLTGETDLVLGVPVANRHREELEGLVGFFVNSLALRTDLSGNPAFAEAMARVRETTLDAYAHQDLPFERLVERISPERDLSKNPLFQVMFVLQNVPAPERRLGKTRLSTLPVALHTTRFDLEVHLFEADEGLEGFLFYDRDLFDATTVERLHRMYSRLLTAAGESPELRISELPLLTSAQIHHLVREHNDVATAYPAGATLDRLFRAVAAATPDAVALAFDDQTVTYGELARRAGRWARLLAARGVQPGDRVGLLLPRSAEMIVATLAVLEAGAAYVPLDPDYPPRRLALLTEDAGLGFILSTAEHAESLPEDLPESVEVWDLASPGARDPGIAELPASGSRRQPQSLAYVVYTSGSTGRPKGVAVSDRAVIRLVRETDYVRLTPRDRIAHASNVAFDAATFEIWGALTSGATLVGVSKWVALTPEAMARKLAEERLTTLFLTTALFQQLVREAPGGFAGVTHLLFGGEACDPNRVRELLEDRPPRRLLHVYGPTESTTYATWHRVETVPEGAVTVPIGRPLANTTAHVVDPEIAPVPLGAPGELVLGADGLAWGYLGRPELTAQRFVPDPYAPTPGGRLYRTGDRVRHRADGAVEFLGRVDHQVKLRGFRIELGEIETALLESPWVRQVVAQVREDSPGDRRLVAYVVPTEEAEEIEPTEDDAERLEEQVSRWEMIFDNIYGDEETHGDATFNIVGWRSTYTGEPLPAEDMREWLDDTVDRILDAGPRRVLEIGCGTGLLLFRIAPRVERYLGLDLSQRALEYVNRQRRNLPGGLPGVTLAQAPADDLRHVEAGAYDTVILNSVVQYFPSVDYLVQVLENAVSALGPEGRIFLGDLRSLPLLETFHTGVQLYRAEDDLPLAQLRHRVRTALEEEEELALDPALFYALARHLPEIRRVEVFPKRGRADNELTRFRYQVVLTVRKGDLDAPPPEAPVQEGHDPDAVRRFVRADRDTRETAAWKDLPNARLGRERAAVELLAAPPPDVETVGDLKARLADLPEPAHPRGAHPQDLWELSNDTWVVTPSWGRHGADGRLDAVTRRRPGGSGTLRAPEPVIDPRKPWSAYGNDPLRGKFARRVAPRLEGWLGERLPTYMIPAVFVPLPEMPLNPNGKVDRKALPVPESLGTGSTAQAAPPRTPEEHAVARVWCDVLGLESVGVEDDFFDLGGHSLLGTQVVSRLRKTLGVELPLSALFETPELGDLARHVARLTGAGEAPAAPPLESLDRETREGELPLSFAQERLWFLDRLESGGSFYNSGAAFDVQGPLSAAALDGTLTRLVARHEALRTTFPLVDGEPVQRIAPPAPARVGRVDLSGLEAADARRTAQRLLGRAYRRLFDLAAGPLARFAWLSLGPRDHRLSLAVHHAVFDGWSLGIVVQEIAELYEALAAGRPDPLPEPEIQYADFAVWQRRWLTGAILESQLGYWRRQLEGITELELPLDRPRPPVQRFRGDTVPLHLPGEAAETLGRLARDRGTTLYVVLLAALETLLARHSRQTDLVVGTPVANRNREEIEGLVGFFANTLVMRGDLSGDPTFGALVERLAPVALEAYAHQDLPFERLVEELQPERDLSRNPIFQVMLALQNAPLPPVEMHGTTLELLPWEGETARFDLEIHLWEGDEGLAGELIYDVDLFDRTTAQRFAASFETLLASAGAAPERALSRLPVLSPAQHHQVRSEWQGAPPPDAVPGDLVGTFLRTAAHRPDAVAVAAGDVAVTYGELARRSLALARHLRRVGVGPDVPVGVCLPRSPAVPTTVLAILAAGGAYVPLDPTYPPERLAFMIEDSRLSLLVTAGKTGPLGRESAGPAVRRLDLESLDPGALEPWEPVPAPPQALAYLIYTSGSTGRPKGIAMPRSVLAHLIGWQVTESPKPRRTLQFAPLSFDVSFQELFATWATGGTLVLVDEETRRQPAELWSEMSRQQVERLFLPFVALDQLAEAAAGDPARRAPGLREVVTAGEQLRTTPALTALFGALPEARLVNQYGPSETHVTTAHELPADPARWTPLPPVGRPVAGGVVRVLGRRGEAVPVGGTGELCLGGVCPARGYLRRPARTAAAFVPDPFADAPGARLYRTGDLARWDAAGNLRFLGRVDQQVKVRGFRVEPGEVEAVLAQHPEVAEAVVVASETEGSAERRLVAYLKLRGETGEDPAVWLRDRLPEYLVPSAFVTVESFPLTPSGKVDRGRLARRSLARTEATPYVAPRTATEVVVANVWADVLGVDRVGARDHFFRVGGHSLLATRVLARIRRELDLELPLKDLFEAPTVAGLAKRAERAIRRRPLPPVTPVPRDGDLPLSFAQQRLWLVDRLEPGTALYNFPLPLRLEGSLRPAALEQALGEIRRRHEILRTAFPEAGEDGDPVQRIAPPTTFRLPRVDLSHLREADRESESRRLASEAYLRPFDLAAGDLWRGELLRLGDDVSVLALHTHHIVFDGASLGVFFHELAALYGAARAGEPSPLPELAIQYGDFAVWQRTHLTDLVLAEQLAHWRHRLAGVAPLELPTDRPRPPVAGSGGGRFETTLSPPVRQALLELADRRGTTPFVIALAATTALLGRLADQDDVAVGTPVAGRTREEIQDLLGFFVQTLVLRTSLAGDPGFLELAARAEETSVAAHGHQDVPFERLVAELADGRDLSRNPLFQVMLAYQELPEEETRLPGLTVSPAPFEITTSKFDLTLSLTDGGSGLRAAWAYRTDLFDATTVRRFARAFETLLLGAAAEPDRPVDALTLLATPERHQTLVEWNDPDWAGPVPAQTLRAALAARAAEQPDAVALVFEDRHLSYGQLSRRAAALATTLRRLGATPGSRVGVCLERRAETTVALLGILEAGAAYVPLDPAFPDERLAALVTEARPVAVVTDAPWESRVPPGPPRLRVDRPAKPLEPGAAMDPDLQPWERDHRGLDLPVYVLFTSGSTGRPKGVVVPNRAVLQRLGWAVTHEPGADRLLQKVSLGFDISVAEVFLPLLAGGTTILAKPGGEKDGAYLARLIDRERIGLAGFATSSLENLLEHGDLLDGSSLRRVLVGAEVVPPDLPARFARHVDAELFNRYGPTEATVSVLSWPCRPGGEGHALPVGRPIAGTRVYLLDRRLEPAPLGVPGQIHLGGPCLATGYLARPERTAAAFVPHPLAGEPGERLYATGDLGRFRGDGALLFLGRIDHQVKVRGLRVELEEVETILARHPAVDRAAVFLADDRLVAWVAPEGAGQDELTRWVSERLPAYMVPAAMGFLPELPTTPSGKVDRRGLARRPLEIPDRDAVGTPATPTEELLALLWAEVLDVESPTPADDFFDLGGHSLLATRLISRVRRVFAVELPLATVFEASELRALAARIDQARRRDDGVSRPPLEPAPEDAPPEPSFGQERLWILDRLEESRRLYLIPAALRLAGVLRPHPLAQAWAEVLRRHQALRTVLPEGDDGRPRIRLRPPTVDPLPGVDLTGLAPQHREAEARRLAAAEARRPLAVERGPLARFRWLRLGTQDHVALVTLHHVIADGWSLGVVFRQLGTLLRSLGAGTRSPLVEPVLQYSDFAAWQRRWLTGEILEAQVDWWRRRLAGVERVLELPTDRPRPPIQQVAGAEVTRVLPRELSTELGVFGRRQGVTPFLLLLAAWGSLLAHLSGQDAVLVGTPVSGRNRAATEDLVGFFVNTLALPVRPEPDRSFRDLLARVREEALAGFAHQDVPFERLVEELVPERRLDRSPLVQAMLAVQNAAEADRRTFDLPGLDVSVLPVPTSTTHFELTLAAVERDGALHLSLVYATSLFDATTARRFLGHLETLLEGVLAAPETPVAELPWLDDAQRHQALVEGIDLAASRSPAAPPEDVAEPPLAPSPGEAPREALEARVAAIFSEVLGVPEVTARDSFFELGGHSLLATRVTSRIRHDFGIELPLRAIFEAPAVGALARRVDARRLEQSAAPPPPLEPAEADAAPVLSFGQERLWYLEQLEETHLLYLIPLGLRLGGDLAPHAFGDAWGEVLRRQRVLRTVLPETHNGPGLRVEPPPVPARAPLADLRGLRPPHREAQLRRLRTVEIRRPMDLATGPLARPSLVRLGSRDHGWLLTLHHVAADGWSVEVLFRELGILRNAFAAGRPSPLEEPPVQYSDFAAWQRRWLTGDVLRRHLSWWRERLAGVPEALELPTDRPRSPATSFAGADVETWLSESLSADLEDVGRRHGATPFLVLLALWGSLLARLSGQSAVAVGTPVAGRDRLELEGLVGLFVNTLVLPVRPRPTGTFLDLLDRVREETLSAFAHQDLPFDRLVEELAPSRHLDRSPLFQVALSVEGAAEAGERAFELPGLEVASLAGDFPQTQFELTLGAVRRQGRWHLSLAYRSDLFDATTAKRHLGHLVTALEAVLAAPETSVAELPFLGDGPRHQLLVEWNDTATVDVPPPTLVHLVLDQVRRVPDAVALVDGTRHLSYGELARRAGHLAVRVKALGVGPETPVAVCLEPSLEMAWAWFGVLAAGGVYVPLAPEHPDARRTHLMADAGARLVVVGPDQAGRFAAAGFDELPVSGVQVDPRCALPEPEPEPDRLAYVLYTSGSTGKPKGVLVPHRGLVALLRWYRRFHGLGPGVRMSQWASPAFDASVLEIWTGLASGATVVVAPPRVRSSAEDLARWLEAEAVAVAFLAPVLARELVAVDRLPPLRRLILGGDRAPRLSRLPFPVLNHYGPTEITVMATAGEIPQDGSEPPIGRPIDDFRLAVLDPALQPVPPGVTGELWISGPGVARGYRNRPRRTAGAFRPHPFAVEPGERAYRTGDLVAWRADGRLDFVGRADDQVKVRGVRVEPGEVEAVLAGHRQVLQAVAALRRVAGDDRLVAWVVPAPDVSGEDLAARVRDHAARHLPQVLRPSFIVPVAEIPRTDRGKIDRDRLPDPALEPAAEPAGAEARLSSLESRLAQAFADVLGVGRVGPRDSFFDLGGHSLLLIRLRSRLKDLGHDVPLLDFFRHPTVRSLAARLAETAPEEAPVRRAAEPGLRVTDRRVAVVGLAGRFPKAADVDTLWRNLEAGVEGITYFSDEELAARGVEGELLADPHYVKGRGLVDDVDRFDAEFFGYAPREAQILDPQQRVFLETCWQALEDAGCDPERFDGRIGVFAAASPSEYLSRLHTRPDLIRALGHLQITLGNQQDFLATRVSYELDLKGPSVAVATACSSSLTAVHLAVRSLVDGECDLALAGGVSIAPLSRGGYLHHPGGISSPDGHTRTFDARGAGTVSSDGAGVVVLRRLDDARTGGDPLRAVILGSAFNNDGSHKVGFTAPGIDGQAEVIRAAQRAAGVEASSIGYVEAHGTATHLGDPIEVAALTRAFRENGDSRRGVCALGSVKSNLGHLDAAAGVTGLIKTVLALEHATLPASLHFEEPNPEVELDDSPFRVVAATEPWEAGDGPRRAGVSSFGLGGTNVHVVLEQAQETRVAEPPHRSRQLLVLSARTPTALGTASERLADHLDAIPDADGTRLADVAWTLQTGRKGFPHRRVLVAETREGAVEALRASAEEAGAAGLGPETGPSLVYLLPGSGAQYPGMGEGLYRGEPVFRQAVDRGAEILKSRLGLDLRRLLFAPATEHEAADRRLRRTDCAMPAVVLVEIAVARLLESWGLTPETLVGHSLGEYAAAHLAGVLRFEDVLALVAERGRLFAGLPTGATLSVELSAEEASRRLPEELSLSAVNGPTLVNVSGPEKAVGRLEAALAVDGIASRRLHVDMAAHSALVEPILDPFGEFLGTLDLEPPRLPYVSGLTGDWIRPEEATDPRYWVRHLRETARFADGAGRLLTDPDRVFLEVGPGRTLATLTRRHPARQDQGVHTSMNPPGASRNDQEVLLEAVGRLWIDGVEPDWAALHGTDRRRRVPLPSYPFERRRHWVQAGDGGPPAAPVEPRVHASTPGEAETAGDVGETRPGAPETPLERRLAGFFRDLLGVDDLGRHDDFFELGGSSLLAVRLRSLLEESFGVPLSPHFLLDAPTVARLARLLETAGAEAAESSRGVPTRSDAPEAPAGRSRLRVRLQEGRPEETPLFLVHPVGGHVYFYRELARELGEELPVWGLRASGLEPGEEPLGSIEEMAARYLDEIQAVQPAGPYRLGGSSLGGVVAFEMARRLVDRGEEVAFLALLDAPGPGHLPPEPADPADLLARLFGEPLGLDAEELRNLDEESRLELVVEAFRQSDEGAGERFGVEEARRQVEVLQAGMAALFAYRGGSHEGSLVFLRARERRPQDPAHPELAWIDRAAGVEVHVVPGDHVSMHQPPHRRVLVERLRSALERSSREVMTR